MLFLLGIIVGMLISVVLLVGVLLFRKPIHHILETSQTVVPSFMKPSGHIYEPPSSAQELREEIIRENDKKGVDTKIEDLI